MLKAIRCYIRLEGGQGEKRLAGGQIHWVQPGLEEAQLQIRALFRSKPTRVLYCALIPTYEYVWSHIIRRSVYFFLIRDAARGVVHQHTLLTGFPPSLLGKRCRYKSVGLSAGSANPMFHCNK
eukprot:19357-Prorocentrum_minimum.AAC.5